MSPEHPYHFSRDRFRQDRLDLFWRFVCERQLIWQRRAVERRPPPWTDDPILQAERFTNVYRELDPGTQYAVRNILEPEEPKPDKIFNIMLYRLIGRAETHAALGFQHLADFDPGHMERTLKLLRRTGRPPFTAAYMVSAYTSMGSSNKIDNVVRVFVDLHHSFPALYERIKASGHASEVHGALSSVYGFGNFLAFQVLVDLLYPVRVYGGRSLLPYSHDDWASAGPGAHRGIVMLLRDRGASSDLDVMRWFRNSQAEEFVRLGLVFPFLRNRSGHPVPISLANMQNCLCEYHKYVKISEGTGRGRRKFFPSPADRAPTQLALGMDGLSSGAA